MTNTAAKHLLENQMQLDADGCNVGVSREALNEVLTSYGEMRTALASLILFTVPKLSNAAALQNAKEVLMKVEGQ